MRQELPRPDCMRLITKKMAAERLCVSTRTIDRMVKKGLLQKIFLGSSPRFRENDIDQVVMNGI